MAATKLYTVKNAENGQVVMQGTLQQWDVWFNKNRGGGYVSSWQVVKDERKEKVILVTPSGHGFV